MVVEKLLVFQSSWFRHYRTSNPPCSLERIQVERLSAKLQDELTAVRQCQEQGSY